MFKLSTNNLKSICFPPWKESSCYIGPNVLTNFELWPRIPHNDALKPTIGLGYIHFLIKGSSIKDVRLSAEGDLFNADLLRTKGFFRMRTSALFGAKTSDFLKFMGCLHGQGGVGVFLRNFVQTSFNVFGERNMTSSHHKKINGVFVQQLEIF